MIVLSSVLDWFTGGVDHPYMRLTHCMNHDSLWIGITVGLDLAVGVGYSIIALHWWQNGRNLPDAPARRAMSNIRNIFVFCAICGYTFIPIKMVWPGWRLYDLFLAVLVYFTWRYAWGAKDLKVVYRELGKTAQLTADLEKSKDESRRKTAFLNALSHDLRTPLNGIALQLEVVRLSAAANDPAILRQAMSQIEASARSAEEMMESLLECARMDWQEEPNHIETFALADLLRACVVEIQPLADNKGLYLQVGDPGHLTIKTDRRKLQRILGNLLANALKFTEQGGVRIAVESAHAALEVHVIDSGVGVSLEQQGRVFEEFYQVDNYARDCQKGFGLGLAIARRLARQIGGEITMESAVGYGSRFTVALAGVVTASAAPVESQSSAVLVAG
jgi:signal transduction histidine kinase